MAEKPLTEYSLDELSAMNARLTQQRKATQKQQREIAAVMSKKAADAAVQKAIDDVEQNHGVKLKAVT